MKKNLLYLFMLMAFMAMPLTSCEKDKDPQEEESQHDPASDEDLVEVTEYDGLEWLQNSIAVVDSKGEVVRRVYGKPLDPSNPNVISVPVKDIKMAENIFLSWVAPGKEAKKVDGGYDYTLTSDKGIELGGVSFRLALASEGGVMARMEVKGGTNLKQISQVNFISSDLWPENDATPKYEAGKLYVINTDYLVRRYYDFEMPFNVEKGDVTFYCIIGNDNGQEAVLIHLSPDENNIDTHGEVWEYKKYDNYQYLASVPEAEKVLKFHDEHYEEWKDMIKHMESIGHIWDWHFGIRTTGNAEFIINSYDKTKDRLKCLDLDKHPGKIAEIVFDIFQYRYILVRTFPPYIEN